MSQPSAVADVVLSCFVQFCIVCQLLLFTVHAIVKFRQHYCNMLWLGLPLKIVQKQQLVQITVAELLIGTIYLGASLPDTTTIIMVAWPLL